MVQATQPMWSMGTPAKHSPSGCPVGVPTAGEFHPTPRVLVQTQSTNASPVWTADLQSIAMAYGASHRNRLAAHVAAGRFFMRIGYLKQIWLKQGPR